MSKRKTLSEFITELNLIYDDKYDYSNVKYVNNKTKVNLICKEHGEFEKTPFELLINKQSCYHCYLY